LRACAKEGRHIILATKSALVLDDAQILKRCVESVVFMSVASLDDEWHATFEPRVPSARQRIECIKQLAAVGVTAAVFIAPILRGHNDKPATIAAVVRMAKDAGASLFVAGLSTSSLGKEDGKWRSGTRSWLATLAAEAPALKEPNVMQRLGPIPQHALYCPDPSRAFGILTTYDNSP
jgi:DNA repair photolyase